MNSNIWFTSDSHFNHTNIIAYSKRPFKSNEEMRESMIHNWNDRVKPGDVVYHLGDVALYWKQDEEYISSILNRLNGNIFLIVGNHDRKWLIDHPRWTKTFHLHEIKVDLGDEYKQRIVLCHYSLRTWNQMNKGSWMLYGHSHGNLPQPPGKTMDVGVDPNGFKPINILEVKEFMDKRPIFLEGDHHKIRRRKKSHA